MLSYQISCSFDFFQCYSITVFFSFLKPNVFISTVIMPNLVQNYDSLNFILKIPKKLTFKGYLKFRKHFSKENIHIVRKAIAIRDIEPSCYFPQLPLYSHTRPAFSLTATGLSIAFTRFFETQYVINAIECRSTFPLNL